MAFEIIRKLKREKLIMVAVIVFLLGAILFTNVYYNNKIQRLKDYHKEQTGLVLECYADIPKSPIVKDRKDKKKW